MVSTENSRATERVKTAVAATVLIWLVLAASSAPTRPLCENRVLRLCQSL